MNDYQSEHEVTERRKLSRRSLLLSLGAAGAAIAMGGIKPGAVQAASHPVVMNVLDYGARGQGRYDEDDAPYIQAAIDRASVAGGIVFVPKGMYILKSGLRLSSKVSLVGAGMDATILKAGSTFINIIAGYHTTDSAIQHITFQGYGSFTLSDHPNVECGILLNQAKDVHISYCGFRMILNGVKVIDSDSVAVEACRFDNVIGIADSKYEGFGVWASGGKNHVISNNQFNHMYKPCVTLTGGNSRSTVMYNRMEKCFHLGIELQADQAKEAGQYHRITGNVIEHTSNPTGKTGFASGIRLSGNCYLNLINHNILTDLEESGVQLIGSAEEEIKRPRSNRIEGNMIKSMKKNGIFIMNAYDNSIESNDIQYSGQEGIVLDTSGKGSGAVSKHNRITGNHIIHGRSAAIRLGAGCRSNTVLGNVGSGNKEGIVDQGTDTITKSL